MGATLFKGAVESLVLDGGRSVAGFGVEGGCAWVDIGAPGTNVKLVSAVVGDAVESFVVRFAIGAAAAFAAGDTRSPVISVCAIDWYSAGKGIEYKHCAGNGKKQHQYCQNWPFVAGNRLESRRERFFGYSVCFFV